MRGEKIVAFFSHTLSCMRVNIISGQGLPCLHERAPLMLECLWVRNFSTSLHFANNVTFYLQYSKALHLPLNVEIQVQYEKLDSVKKLAKSKPKEKNDCNEVSAHIRSYILCKHSWLI